jgi:hypothetical protein
MPFGIALAVRASAVYTRSDSGSFHEHSKQEPDCRRFCDCESFHLQQIARAFNRRPVTDSISITYQPKNSRDFNKQLNLVRDQVVGGLNPLFPSMEEGMSRVWVNVLDQN